MKIEIEKIVFNGYGIGRITSSHKNILGKTIFVSKAVPGDILDVDIYSDKKSFAFAKIDKIIKRSKLRITPKCEKFDLCGGCEHQNLDYKNQLKIKDEIFREVIEREGIQTKILPIIEGSEKPFFYRNSIRFFLMKNDNNQFQFARHNFYQDDKFVAIEKCYLQSEKSNQIIEALQKLLNLKDEETSIWQIKIREGKKTGNILIELITDNQDLKFSNEIVEILQKIDGVKSIYQTITPAKSGRNVIRKLLFGSPIIFENIGKFKFQISPESFFQTNSEGVEKLYSIIKKYADVAVGDEVADLYSGTGSIGIYLSLFAKKIYGIESISKAVLDAKYNAKINRISNCEFIQSDVGKYFTKNENFLDGKIVIADPPRAGLKPDVIGNIARSKFKKLIYVSCNPSTFARDIKIFEKDGIKLDYVQPVDMFPQTHHIECVGLLEKS